MKKTKNEASQEKEPINELCEFGTLLQYVDNELLPELAKQMFLLDKSLKFRDIAQYKEHLNFHVEGAKTVINSFIDALAEHYNRARVGWG